MENKFCSHCLLFLPVDNFYIDNRKCRRYNICKSCFAERYHEKKHDETFITKRKQYYINNREKKLTYQNQYNKKNRELINEYLALLKASAQHAHYHRRWLANVPDMDISKIT